MEEEDRVGTFSETNGEPLGVFEGYSAMADELINVEQPPQQRPA